MSDYDPNDIMKPPTREQLHAALDAFLAERRTIQGRDGYPDIPVEDIHQFNDIIMMISHMKAERDYDGSNVFDWRIIDKKHFHLHDFIERREGRDMTKAETAEWMEHATFLAKLMMGTAERIIGTVNCYARELAQDAKRLEGKK